MRSLILALVCAAGSLLSWDALPPDGGTAIHYEVRLNSVVVWTGTDTSADIGTACGIASVRAVDGAGNVGPSNSLLVYGPCAVGCDWAQVPDLEAAGCCPVARVPWWP